MSQDNSAEEELKIPWKYSEPVLFFVYCINRKKYELVRASRKRIEMQLRIKDYNHDLVFHHKPLDRIAFFKHSGTAGDVIYSLQSVKVLAGSFGAGLLLALDVPMIGKIIKHPLGNVMLNRKMLEMFQPLLLAQNYIKSVEAYDGRPVDFDLDAVRQAPVNGMAASRWWFYLFGTPGDLAEPWLTVKPDNEFPQKIILSRSFRCRNFTLDYRFLRRYRNIVFVGVEEEFNDMKKLLPELEWAPVRDFLEMARIIAGCRLFIGNQSFPFSLAEALKVPRILEVDPSVPNVIPIGKKAFEVLFQKQFEQIVGQILES
jgi:hypothetical protein